MTTTNALPDGLLMGFDFGTQRIGLAVGQRVTRTASAIAILKARDGVPDWDELETLITNWNPVGFIVGDPLNMDGTESEMSVRARRFARRLTGRFDRPAAMMDERLSSFEARDDAKDGPRPRGPVDAVAARLILESYLNAEMSMPPSGGDNSNG